MPKFISNNSFNPLNTAAASVLPPANPAATGILLIKLISTPLFILYVSKNNLTAL